MSGMPGSVTGRYYHVLLCVRLDLNLLTVVTNRLLKVLVPPLLTLPIRTSLLCARGCRWYRLCRVPLEKITHGVTLSLAETLPCKVCRCLNSLVLLFMCGCRLSLVLLCSRLIVWRVWVEVPCPDV